MVGFMLDREDTNSLPNLGRHGSTDRTGMGGHVVRPGNAGTEAPRAIRPFAGRNSTHRGAAVRAAAAHGDAARLQRTVEEGGWIIYPAVGTEVGAPDALQTRLEVVFSGVEG